MGKGWKTAAVLLAVLLAGCGSPANSGATASPTATVEQNLDTEPERVSTILPASGIPSVVEKVSPAVVGLAVTVASAQSGQTVEGLGSGVIVDSKGYILTNNHVVGNADTITVVMEDGSQLPGRNLWTDAALDLAVVKVDADGALPYAQMGSSQSLRVGDTVVAIGTPLTLNFQHTVTAGIVSALRRTLKVPTDGGLSFMEELIQSDAPINPGNSGGPLCDSAGRVVGINTLKVTEAEGIGFAIPIEVAEPIVERIKKDGTYTTPYVGLFTIDGEIARYYGETAVTGGVLVINVDPDGPGAAAGFQQGDLLTHLDGQTVDTVLKMRQVLYAHKPGEQIAARWERNGRVNETAIALTSKPVE